MSTITAIIPAYNGVTRYLEQAIQSILAQSFQDFELIVVDDASTDDTESVVRRFSRAHYFRRTQNGRQATARNDGARLASGTYIAFLDQDDLWEPTLLEDTLKVIVQHPHAAAVHVDGYQVNEHNEILQYSTTLEDILSIKQILRGAHSLETSGSLIRKAAFDTVGGYDEQLTIWEDIDLGIRLYQRFPLVHLPKPLFRHRIYGHNASRLIPSAHTLVSGKRLLHKYGHSCKPGSREALGLKRDWATYYCDMGKYLIRTGRPGQARAALWRSLQFHPFNKKAILRLLKSLVSIRRPRVSRIR